jgi:hypothetical protein
MEGGQVLSLEGTIATFQHLIVQGTGRWLDEKILPPQTGLFL